MLISSFSSFVARTDAAKTIPRFLDAHVIIIIIINLFITSATEVMFYPAFVCLSV